MLKFLMTLTVVCLSAAGLFLFTAPNKQPITSENTSSDQPTAGSTSSAAPKNIDKPKLLIGSPDAAVVIVEYADFKCPACNQFHHSVGKQLRETYVQDGSVVIEFRNYPFIGPDSGRAARGSYCANDQGVFTVYHDRVYQYLWNEYYTQNDIQAEFRDVLTSSKLVELMDDVLEDKKTFSDCLESSVYNKYIDMDLELGADDGIPGTPGFTVAGRKINGPSNLNTFKTLIDIELKKL